MLLCVNSCALRINTLEIKEVSREPSAVVLSGGKAGVKAALSDSQSVGLEHANMQNFLWKFT